MPSEPPETGGSSTLERQDLSQFFAHMTEGLHAMAQPLTILRSSIPALAAVDLTPAKQQRYLELSVRQVQRVCALFDCLQDLVVAGQTQAECVPFDFAATVAAVVGDRRRAFQDLGAELRVALPGNLPMVLGDASRTLQALTAGLTVATLVAVSGDVVEIAATARNRRVELVLHLDRVHGKGLESPERLNLRLAQVNIASQRGEYEYIEDPFRVRLALPSA
jgi:light-regulated signal transduction histidine kinase (bacteriophytochrome)